MDMELAIRMLVNAGYLVTIDKIGCMIVVSSPTHSVQILETQVILHPYDPEFVTFFQCHENVQIFFD